MTSEVGEGILTPPVRRRWRASAPATPPRRRP